MLFLIKASNITASDTAKTEMKKEQQVHASSQKEENECNKAYGETPGLHASHYACKTL